MDNFLLTVALEDSWHEGVEEDGDEEGGVVTIGSTTFFSSSGRSESDWLV